MSRAKGASTTIYPEKTNVSQALPLTYIHMYIYIHIYTERERERVTTQFEGCSLFGDVGACRWAEGTAIGDFDPRKVSQVCKKFEYNGVHMEKEMEEFMETGLT